MKSLFLLTFCIVALVACGDPRSLDGSSPEAFSRSVPAVARTLPEAERPDFISNLTLVAQANGSISLDQPAIATLVALDGASPERVQQLAAGVRQAQERARTEQLLSTAEREAEVLSKRLEFAREQLQEAEEDKNRLSKLSVSEVTSAPAGQGGLELRFRIRNGNEVPVQIRGVALDIRQAGGLEKSLGPGTMLAISNGCLFGQKLGPAFETSSACILREKHDPTAEYGLRVVEIHVPGEPPRLSGLGSLASKQQSAAELQSELVTKQQEVDSLRAKLGLAK